MTLRINYLAEAIHIHTWSLPVGNAASSPLTQLAPRMHEEAYQFILSSSDSPAILTAGFSTFTYMRKLHHPAGDRTACPLSSACPWESMQPLIALDPSRPILCCLPRSLAPTGTSSSATAARGDGGRADVLFDVTGV
jgi:hypothetical protein